VAFRITPTGVAAAAILVTPVAAFIGGLIQRREERVHDKVKRAEERSHDREMRVEDREHDREMRQAQFDHERSIRQVERNQERAAQVYLELLDAMHEGFVGFISKNSSQADVRKVVDELFRAKARVSKARAGVMTYGNASLIEAINAWDGRVSATCAGFLAIVVTDTDWAVVNKEALREMYSAARTAIGPVEALVNAEMRGLTNPDA